MDRNLASAIRILAADMVETANSGHPGMPLGMADICTVLFHKFLRFNPVQPNWHERDRFILSAGHGSALLYALLYLTGYPEMTINELKNFRQLHSKTPGHPEYGITIGAETSTGPLGQGLANAVGMALSAQIQYARGQLSHLPKIYVIVGDGCLAEGISHEAISFAGHMQLNNLVVLFDDNNVTIDGSTSLSTSDNQLQRFGASRWQVMAIDGHDYTQIENALAEAQVIAKPMMIACKTIIGFGAPNKAGSAAVHGSPLGKEEVVLLRQNLNWPHPPFEIPDDILHQWRQCGVKELGKEAEVCDILPAINILEDLKKELLSQNVSEATRKSSERVIEAIYKQPYLLGGSADLTPSNNTKAKQVKVISAQDYSGSYIHYGIREHAMAAIMNGIALFGGFKPFGGTFLTFSDYARPAIRLAALMKLPATYVMTHDSIGLGEDGPTHQPVEHLAALRAIPNLNVMRPCDVIETIECWQLALQSSHTPTLLALSRQNLKQLCHTREENLSRLGAYILAEQKDFKVSIFASGSEVAVAMEVAERLYREKGIASRVISVPCLDLFFAQPMEYQVQLLCNKSFKIAIEAGVEQGWHKIIGPHGMFFGVESFGESAPGAKLFEHFGLTATQIYEALIANGIGGK